MTHSKDKHAGEIDQNLIRDLANLLTETELSEIEVETNGLRLRVARQLSGTVTAVAPAAAPVAVAAPAATVAETASGGDLSDHPGAVTSPMVGTIYLSPEPGAAAFISEGDQVSEGQTLLIVEAMKTMNAIPAPRSGKVAKILVANEQPIEFGEVLVIIE